MLIHKNSVLIDQLREICHGRVLLDGGAGKKEGPVAVEANKQEMEVEEPKPETPKPTTKTAKGRGGKRAADTKIDDAKAKQAKVVEETSPTDLPKTPPKTETAKEFMSPLLSTKKFAASARTFLTPVKNTPGKAIITPRSLKPVQGKILPKSPLLFSFDATKSAHPMSEVTQDERY